MPPDCHEGTHLIYPNDWHHSLTTKRMLIIPYYLVKNTQLQDSK